MNPSVILWAVLVPLLLTNSVLWMAVAHQPLMSAVWLALAIGGKKLFLSDDASYSSPRRARRT